jgi:hypothetical protein
MAPHEQQNPYAAWSQIVLVLLLAAGALWLPPLVSERPAPSGLGTASPGVQDVDARLWQDPFGAVQKAAEKQRAEAAARRVECLAQGARPNRDGQLSLANGKPCEQVRERAFKWLRELIEHRQGPGTLVVYALTPGGAWVGADEARRRQRYAVLTALNDQGYAPGDPEHIGFIQDTLLCARLTLPFEWLVHRDSGARALLLWVDEEALNLQVSRCEGAEDADPVPGPLARLARLHEQINPPLDDEEQRGHLILGPMSSGSLQAFAHEVCRSLHIDATLASLRPIPWYSALATLPDSAIALPCKPGKKLSDVLPRLVRATPTDDALLDALLAELMARGVAPGATVALVGQWDTAYSRYLEKYLKDRLGKVCEVDADMSKDKVCVQVMSASYLRGLDGQRAERANDSDKGRSQGGKDKPATDLERPEGEAQIDYLRRLAAYLHEHGRHIAAVGVLGNDYHDKLLVLEALRPTFPQAVFFTTDLDAAMLHPRDNRHTRNLVVASGFGLSLRPEVQPGVPPFRDTYQTASYLATRVALARASGEGPGDENYAQWFRPQLFEIGRYAPVALAVPGGAAVSTTCPHLAGCENPHEALASAPSPLAALYAPAAALAIALISAAAGFVRREWLCAWTGFIGLALLASIGVIWAMRQPVAEPFSWIQGVSIWPSEFLRALAFALSIFLLLRGRAQLAATADMLQRRYGLSAPETSPTQPLSRRVTHGLRVLWHEAATLPRELFGRCALRQGRSDPGTAPVPRDVGTIWRHYLSPKDNAALPWVLRWPAATRGVVFVILFFVGARLFSATLGWDMPASPLRGNAAWGADKIFLALTVAAYMALLFFALDQVSRAIWLAKQLRGKTDWPDSTMLHYLRQGSEDGEPGTNAAMPAPPRDSRVFDDWLDAQLIASVTEPVQRIVFYPFAVLVLLILARSSLFDSWSMPPMLLLVFGASIVLIVGAAFRLRMTAERVRSEALRWLNIHIMDAQARDDRALAVQLDHMLRQVRELNIGAFAPFSQQPLFRAALAILGSFSGIALLEYASEARF